MQLHVVSHTHWDREWYHGAALFRQRLVRLVDELLEPAGDLAGSGRPPSFLLDGQAVVLEDYLAVRPDRRPLLEAALGERRLEAGPWYVLADGLIPSGESLLRNLLVGRAILAGLGAAPPPVLYAPDSFGHPAAMPLLAHGFGFDLAIVWRGYGGRRWPPGDSAWWEADGGGRVLIHHLAPDGYELGSNLPVDERHARKRWARLRAILEPRARLGLVLLPNGADHHALQSDAAAAVGTLSSVLGSHDEIHWSSLGGFARELTDRARAATLPTVRGELRDSYGYTWTLQGTFATRAAQKRDAARAERLLLRKVEPWLALSPLGTDPAMRALLGAAWRTLLRCHPHDTLCGCSTDEVARAMDARLESVRSQGRGLRQMALHALAGHDPEAARVRPHLWRPVLAVRNDAPRARGGVAEVEILSFVRHVPVGPGSGTDPARALQRARMTGAPLVDGGRVPVQPLRSALAHDLVESPRHYPDCDLVRRTRALAWMPAIEGCSLRTFPLDDRPGNEMAVGPVSPARAGERWLDNGRLRVEVDARGRVSVLAASGRLIQDLLALEDVGDRGDCYTHSPVGEPELLRGVPRVRTVHEGPLRASLLLDYAPLLPAWRGRRRSSARRVACPVRVTLSLDAESELLRIHVRGLNRARDHRLRLVLRTGVAGGEHRADAAFGPVMREPIRVPQADKAAERPPGTDPLHRYVCLDDGMRGAAVLSDGLAEYEVSPAGEVSVTLVRAVGALSRSDLPERPGHAGWPRSTPQAQSRGPFRARLALLLLEPWQAGSLAVVERAADDFLLPLTGTTWRSATGAPASHGGVELSGEGLVFGALKPAESPEWRLVLRCVNVLDCPVEGSWRLPFVPAAAVLARLDESVTGPAPEARDGRLSFSARAREVVTILVR